jgi:hypothetical protein
MTGLFSEVPTEELAIWATVGVALLLVAVMIWRGEPMPTIETHHDEHRDDPQIHDLLEVADKDQDSDERTWRANNLHPKKQPVKAAAEAESA